MNRFFLTILLIIFCVVGYFAYTVFSKRESDLIKTTSSPTTQGDQTSASGKTDASNKPQENIIENLLNNDESTQENTNGENTDTTTEDTNIYINVTPPDCMRECEPYKYDEKELKYCQNVCGISENTSANDCDKLKDLDKDYCYKSQAIEKKDASICDNISDTAVKRSCKNRIQEDILENM